MAKGRRTKRQKMVARHVLPSYTLPELDLAKPVETTEESRAPHQSMFTPHQNATMSDRGAGFSYDPSLIKADLTKTVFLSILAIATIVVIFLLKLI